MKYYSTNRISPEVDFKEATIRGQAPDKGLYFPVNIPPMPQSQKNEIKNYSREEIAFKAIQPYVGDCIPASELKKIVAETIDFDFPLIQVEENIFSLELFHGPTMAFKDVGARFMSRCLRYFVRNNDNHITVLVATSGDTGSAVADGFYDVDGVDVKILYPSGKVSKVQELQLTTHGRNITAFEIDGTFDDCQQMVKNAFADEQLNSELNLTSANSINVARWLPQQFFYFFAYRDWNAKSSPPVISVPSGNLGNICAGLLAYRSGLPVKKFIAACNANGTIHSFLQTGTFTPAATKHTISNAMDVGNPSNLPRILELFDHKFERLSTVLSSYSISDSETKKIIKEIYENNNYLLDPHGAVGYLALKRYLSIHTDKGIFLETAHPVKFYDVVEPIINATIARPAKFEKTINKEKKSLKIPASFDVLKEYLLSERK